MAVKTIRIAASVPVFLAAVCASAAAQGDGDRLTGQPQAVHLAGGASAITETHGNWIVNCQVVGNAKACSASHQQFDSNNQRIFAVELAPLGQEASGNAALPFGLALQRGVTLSVDGAAVGETRLFFSTCMIGGCLVPLAFDEATLATLKGGAVLRIKGVALDSEREIEFSVPLSGFASALARTGELLRD